MLFRFTIRHNNIWPFEATPLFCHSCLVRCQSLLFQKCAGTGIFIWPPQHTKDKENDKCKKLPTNHMTSLNI